MASRAGKPSAFKVLSDACYTGDTSYLSQLIAENKFQVNESMDDTSKTSLPLVSAINHASLPVVSLLLANGANPNVSDDQNCRPLRQAIGKEYLNIARVLLDHGADPNLDDGWAVEYAINSENQYLLEILLQKGAKVNYLMKYHPLNKYFPDHAKC